MSTQPENSCDSWPWAVSGSLGCLRLLNLKWRLAAGKPLPPSEAGLLVPVAQLQLGNLGLHGSGSITAACGWDPNEPTGPERQPARMEGTGVLPPPEGAGEVSGEHRSFVWRPAWHSGSDLWASSGLWNYPRPVRLG